MKKSAFTLAEVLITLAIIGVIAAVSIPSVISNSQQQEFRTGLRKAISVLNSAITMNMALDGETPYDNANLYGYLIRHMSVLKTTSRLPYYAFVDSSAGRFNALDNAALYTTDGMRFEFNGANNLNTGSTKLHESGIYPCSTTNSLMNKDNVSHCGGCGSWGLNSNTKNTTLPPCLILVDVNGDRKPTPGNANCADTDCAAKSNLYKVPLPAERKVRDIFSILITEDRAIPFGVTAQKAMYSAQK
ncbi:MAG: type II secretion system protein [bacterium]|nr:type II secretion system protein [bacterium]